MKVIILLIVIFFVAAPGRPQVAPSLPPGIEVLRSTKDDLEKVAKLESNTRTSGRFDYLGTKIEAKIAEEPCTWHGWNVEKGTILFLTMYPQPVQKLNFSHLDTDRFELYRDHTFREFFTEKRSAIQFYVEPDREPSIRSLISVRYYPSEKHSALRCGGFPQFNAATEPYDIQDPPFKVGAFDEWDKTMLADLSARMRESEKLAGTVFIYFKKDQYEQARAFQKELREYMGDLLYAPLDRFEVRLGGIRDENEIETYLLFSHQPHPTPRPKYASPMVF